MRYSFMLLFVIVFGLSIAVYADSTNTQSELFDGPPHLSNGKALSPGWEIRIDYTAETNLRLFWVASSGEPKWETIRKLADSTIVSRGKLAVPFLLTKLSTDDARDRQAVNQLLKKIGTPAVEPLLTVIDTSHSRDEITLAIQTLGDIGDSTALPRLLQTASDSLSWKRSSSAMALMTYPKLPPLVIEKLRTLAQDKYPGIRRNAIRGLILQSDLASIPIIVNALSDSMYSIRETIMQAIAAPLAKKDSADTMKREVRKAFRSALRDTLEARLLPVLEEQKVLEWQDQFGVVSNVRSGRANRLPIVEERILFQYLRAYRLLEGTRKEIWSRAAMHRNPAIRAEAVSLGIKKRDNGKLEAAHYAKKLLSDPDPIVQSAIDSIPVGAYGIRPNR